MILLNQHAVIPAMNPTKLSSIVTIIGVSALSVLASTQTQAVSLLGLTDDNTLVSFDSNFY